MKKLLPLVLALSFLSACRHQSFPVLNKPMSVAFEANDSNYNWTAVWKGIGYPAIVNLSYRVIPKGATGQDTVVVFLSGYQLKGGSYFITDSTPTFTLTGVALQPGDTTVQLQSYAYAYNPVSTITHDTITYGYQNPSFHGEEMDIINGESWQLLSDTITITALNNGYSSGTFSATLIKGNNYLHITHGTFQDALTGD